MPTLRTLLLALTLCTAAAHATPLSGEEITRLPVAEIIARVPQSHPSAAAWQGQRTGLQCPRDQILAQQERIREQRTQRGLEMRE